MSERPSPGTAASTSQHAGWMLLLFSLAVAVVVFSLIAVGSVERRIKTVQLKAKAVSSRDAKHAKQALVAEIRQRFAQGVTMLQLREYSHAITAFHRVLALDPKIPEAHVNMGYAYLGLRDYQGARRFFAGALALAPHTANAHFGMALCEAEEGRLVVAIEAMRRYLAFAAPDDPFRAQGEAKVAEMTARLNDQTAATPSAQSQAK